MSRGRRFRREPGRAEVSVTSQSALGPGISVSRKGRDRRFSMWGLVRSLSNTVIITSAVFLSSPSSSSSSLRSSRSSSEYNTRILDLRCNACIHTYIYTHINIYIHICSWFQRCTHPCCRGRVHARHSQRDFTDMTAASPISAGLPFQHRTFPSCISLLLLHVLYIQYSRGPPREESRASS
jgi:hypothetical protein